MGGVRKKILILDHDERVLIDLERILEDEGFASRQWHGSPLLS